MIITRLVVYETQTLGMSHLKSFLHFCELRWGIWSSWTSSSRFKGTAHYFSKQMPLMAWLCEYSLSNRNEERRGEKKQMAESACTDTTEVIWLYTLRYFVTFCSERSKWECVKVGLGFVSSFGGCFDRVFQNPKLCQLRAWCI